MYSENIRERERERERKRECRGGMLSRSKNNARLMEVTVNTQPSIAVYLWYIYIYGSYLNFITLQLTLFREFNLRVNVHIEKNLCSIKTVL